MTFPIIDFPKIGSPFVRKTINGRYVVTPEIAEGYEWVFEDSGVKAVDKLHGSNICVHFQNGIVTAIDNRSTRVMMNPFISLYIPKITQRMIQGVINSIEMGLVWDIETGSVYGEIIGPSWNKNIHGADHPIFVPFDTLEDKYHWNTWIQGKYPKDFNSISTWFKELPSIFSKKKLKKDCLAEGLVFTHLDGRMAKLRRDMFDWYEGEDHKGFECYDE